MWPMLLHGHRLLMVCICVVGAANQPLYLRSIPAVEGEQLTRLHLVAHCALDALEEKGAANCAAAA